MSSFRMDQSENQIVDFKGMILQINFFIVQNAAFGNKSAVFELVEQFDILMEPYKDPKYNEDMKIDSNGNSKPSCEDEARAIQAIDSQNQISQKQRALISLAYRKGFLPSASTGSGGLGNE